MGKEDQLLPSQTEQFESRAYWDSFFQQRDKQSFEWYGSFRDLKPLIQTFLRPKDEVLVIGCGNSDFSECLYKEQDCQNILNVDFSGPVIEEMKGKTSSCPKMQWQVMDVTALDLEDSCIDVVFDKGTLDAVYSTSDSESQVDRVLKVKSGRYFVVTLGQEFILSKLLSFFCREGCGWHMALHTVEASTQSALLILGAVATRVAGGTGHAVSMYFDESAKKLTKPLRCGTAAATALVMQAQLRYKTRYEIRQIRPHRFLGDIDIWFSKAENSGGRGPRYTIHIVDVIPSTRPFSPVGVFIVPQGRAHEWLFSTPEGLRAVATSAVYQRLICVRMNREHSFPGLEEVQRELNSIVMDFVPEGLDSAYQIAYVTVGGDSGSCNILEEGELPLVARYFVEEEEDGEHGEVLRRLVFARNQHIIQSEVRLQPNDRSRRSSAASKMRGKVRKKGGKTKRHAASVEPQAGRAEAALSIDYSHLSFDYHRAILAGVLLLQHSHLKAAKAADSQIRCLLLGLGGGGLALFLRRYFPCLDVTVVELEGGLVEIARRWFGFPMDGKGNGLDVVVQDGIEFVQKAEARMWDIIIIDVDNKDPSLGISCPAPEFVARSFLEACQACLTEIGILVTNIAARSSELLRQSLHAFEDAFGPSGADGGRLFELRPSERDVNRVVFACMAAHPKVVVGQRIESWLSDVNGPGLGDPLQLEDLGLRVEKMKQR